MLTEAEINDLIVRLLQDSNSATFATMLDGRLHKSPAKYTSSPNFDVQLRATFIGVQEEGAMLDLLMAIASLPGEARPSRISAVSMLYKYQGGGGLQRLLAYSERYEAQWAWEMNTFITGHVCMVEIDGNPEGTGVLVGPDQVLTAHHVVESQLVQAASGAPGTCTAAAGSAGRVKCRFDFAVRRGLGGRKQLFHGNYVSVADDWLGPHSPPHSDERAGRAPPDSPESHTLDYALITLDGSAGTQTNGRGTVRGWSALASPPRPLEPFGSLRIIQHPSGAPVKSADGFVTAIGKNARLRYYVSAANGSSGAPCWNKEFELVAIHNLGGLMAPVGMENQGVPIDLIIDHIRTHFAAYAIPAPYRDTAPDDAIVVANGTPITETFVGSDKPIWCISKDYPVLDRAPFQATIRQMCAPGGEQILRVNGSRYSGRSFSEKIAKRLLERLGHTVHSLSAVAVAGMKPERFVNDLCLSVGLDPVKAPEGVEFSTRPNVVQRHLLTDLLKHIKQVYSNNGAAPRLLWIIVDALDQATLVAETLELLIALVQRVGEAPGLRVVLIGYEPDLPPEVDALLAEEFVPPVSQSDVVSYLRYVCEQAERSMPEAKSLELAEMIFTQAPEEPAQRLRMIAQNVQKIARKLQGVAAVTDQKGA
ncbi:trypsin-like serine peptidase [Caballeronia sordidicola]|uniref:Trypsin-like peptidase n=1 Tax=Caballeronia sordidicola TaxID=196367 RepID=A0A226WQF2_CABSO|nr:trypsin-like peptidase domain-containing protein [Caballeronia sordidicola]OXC73412.1 hypothetical protein BSU04_37080 [Caballeronia sordidicola]